MGERKGKKSSPSELHDHLLQSFNEVLEKKKQRLYRKHDISEVQVKEAAKKFENDSEYKALIESINKKCSKAVQLPSKKISKDLELPMLKNVFESLIQSNTQMWDEIEEHVKGKGPNKKEEIESLVQLKSVDACETSFEKFGIDKYIFEAS